MKITWEAVLSKVLAPNEGPIDGIEYKVPKGRGWQGQGRDLTKISM